MTRPQKPKADSTPLPIGAANFRDKAFKVDERRFTIKPSRGIRLIALLFTLVGLLPLSFSAYRLLLNHRQTEYWVLGGFGLLFFMAGAITFIVPRRFDFNLDAGEFTARRLWFRSRRPLSQIVAIQAIHGGWHTTKTRGEGRISYQSYQLNLVVDNPDVPRLNLSNHPDWDWTWSCGNALAEFLHIPYLDSVSERE